MSIGSCETIDLNNLTRNTNSTHETNDLSLSINNNNINNSSKISNSGLITEQNGSPSAKAFNGENMNKELLEDKKRKLRLPLVSSSPNTEQSNFNSTSSDSISGTNSNSFSFLLGNSNDGNEQNLNKKHKAYFNDGLINFPNCLGSSLSVNETPSLNKDLIKHLDQNNNLTTPQIDKLINDLNSNSMKTPGSALALLGGNNNFFTPQTEFNILQNLANGDSITPGSSINPSIIFSTLNQSSSATSTAAISAATVVIAPTSVSNSNNKYATLTNVSTNMNNSNTGNYVLQHNNNNSSIGLSGHGDNHNAHEYKNIQYGDNNNIISNKTMNIKDERDILQTVPIHPNNMLNNRTLNKQSTLNNNKTRNKQSGKTPKSASINKSSDSFNDSSTNTPNSSSFNSRRDTGNSTSSSSSNLDTSFSPINLDKQETLKLEKKRERNREAARKCRTRKLEKIATLEIQVKNLTETNEQEKAKTDKLREEINIIRLKLEQHKKVHNCDLKLTI